MNFKSIFIIVIAIFIGVFYSTAVVVNDKSRKKDTLSICEGIVCQKAQRLKFIGPNKTKYTIKLTAPVIVAQAEQEESWGFFQFPTIVKADSGKLIVSWQMMEDSYKSYGKKTSRAYTPMMSKDGGLTWKPLDKWSVGKRRDYNVCDFNGKQLQVTTPSAKDIRSYKLFPKPVEVNGSRSFYLMDSVPNELQGIYLNIRQGNSKSTNIHAKLNDPGLLRYTTDGFMPIVWWGNIRQLADHSLVAGIYPCYYLDSLGHVMRSAISFYQSKDEGHSWSVIGKIPFCFDGIADKHGDKRFDEPTYEILADSTFLCVMRSGSISPMYKSFSYDHGKSWSVPEPFTPNGVKPNLLLLNNGVLVLISGRPGIQIRFSLDGTGRTWTEPIDMIPFMRPDGTYIRDVSCGYASFVDDSDDSFYLVYSDFTTKNARAETRKSILCRKITVIKNN